MLEEHEVEEMADSLRPYFERFATTRIDLSVKVTWLLFQEECEGLPYVDIQKIADKL